ncbi:glycoside hydrolase family 26 protein [Candidatus Omnitrophota bacterium]
MWLRCIIVIVFILLLTGKVFSDPDGNGARFSPPEGKILLIIGQYKEAIDTYVEELGHIPAGIAVYTSVQNAEGIYEAFDHGGGAQHLQYEVEKYPNAVMQVGLYMVDVLEEIVSGKYDDNLEKIGTWVKNTNRPVYFRIGYEFDGPHNHYDPGLYVKAYRYIVEKFRAMDVRNVAYVWHSYASYTERPIIDWYPGDEYVDWVAISYFRNIQKFLDRIVNIAREHNKPLMIAEATPFGIGVRYGDYALERWYEPFFKFIDTNDVGAVSYINCDWEALPMWTGQGWKDSRVEANPIIKKRWLEEVRKEKYLKSSSGLYALLGFEPEK